jgi:hypothetical protein
LSKRILVIPDIQAKPGVDLSHLEWCGKYIADKRPDVIVNLGDTFDMESLSSYDKGKLSAEGRRFKDDLEAGKKALRLLLAPLKELQEKQRNDRKKVYNPRLVFCMGNHEERADRVASLNPEFAGYIGSDLLGIDEDWEVYGFLQPVEIDGIFFVHYLANPMTGRPYSGTAMNQLKTVGRSFVVGHKQVLDIAIRPTLDGKHQIGIVAGAFYQHDEDYKGPTGNNHWRGIVMLNEVNDGYGDVMPISISYLKRKYGKDD